MRLTPEAADFLLDLAEIDERLRRDQRVDAILLIQTGPRYGLKPGARTPRTLAHPGLVDELETAGFVRTEAATSRGVSRKLRVTGEGREFAGRLARSDER